MLFDAHRETLHFPGVSVVYSVPTYLGFHANLKSAQRVFTLGSVRVLERSSAVAMEGPQRPERSKEGLEKMRELVRKRFADYTSVLTDEAIYELVAHSGGDLREFFIRSELSQRARAS